jgi:hypothetical protein
VIVYWWLILTTIQKVFFIIFAVAVLSGCVNTPPPDNTPIPTATPVQTPNLTKTVSPTEIINVTTNESDIIPNSEYEVYSSVLLNKYPHPANKIVIYQLTANQTICNNYDCFQNFKNYSFKNYSLLVDDYKNKNAKVYKLENKFLIPHTVILISSKELNEIFQNETGWNAFYEKYPNSPGTIQISRVGFNSNQTQAILYFGYQRGFLSGEGFRIFLTKDEGKWKVEEEVLMWVS